MGVLVRGMEMPKGCATCPYCDRAWNKPKCKAKSMKGRFMEQKLNLDRTRQKWCPLVPVPPHGDLIDREALMKDFDSPYRFRTFGDVPVFHEEAIRTAPTIIPASKEGEQ